jgi:hypothetical protein
MDASVESVRVAMGKYSGDIIRKRGKGKSDCEAGLAFEVLRCAGELRMPHRRFAYCEILYGLVLVSL